MERASAWPLTRCLVTAGWRDRAQVNVVFVRQNAHGRCAAAGFQVDLACLGIKCTVGEINVDPQVVEDLIELFSIDGELTACDPALAAKIVATGRAYGESLGFEAHEDDAWTRHLITPIDPTDCETPIHTGQGGKPLFQPEPGDDLGDVFGQLEARLGPDGFLMLAHLGTTPQA